MKRTLAAAIVIACLCPLETIAGLRDGTHEIRAGDQNAILVYGWANLGTCNKNPLRPTRTEFVTGVTMKPPGAGSLIVANRDPTLGSRGDGLRYVAACNKLIRFWPVYFKPRKDLSPGTVIEIRFRGETKSIWITVTN